MTQIHKFNYNWLLSNGYPAPGIEQHNKTVFTTFSCGGGSSMGYKLAGYNVFAANDIDPQMKKVYEANHHPKYYYLAPIKELLVKIDWPEEFRNLDVLDGSPPCSTFSVAGLREKAWGKDKHFREGQAKQVLDDLFFDFIALAKKLQPKVVISENVKGLLGGHAKGYVKEIMKQFDEAGYYTQLFLLNAATMGVPQRRERVFFLSKRKDLSPSKIDIQFNERPILYREIKGEPGKKLGIETTYYKRWLKRRPGDKCFADIAMRETGQNSGFTDRFVLNNEVPPTLTAKNDSLTRFDVPNHIGEKESLTISTFPQDYNMLNMSVNYLCGMSVPPVMTAQVSHQVYLQWLSRI